MKRIIPALLLILLVGCKAPIHPGTANAFDSDAYNILLTTDSVIQSTRVDYNSGQFPASIMPAVKTALNDLITAYDALDTVYCGAPVAGSAPGSLQCASTSYHAAAMTGTATPAQSQAVTSAESNVTTATATLANAKAGT